MPMRKIEMLFVRKQKIPVAVAVVVLASLATWVGTRKTVAQVLGPRPMTVRYVESHFRDSDGALTFQSQKVWAVRSDGSVVEPRLPGAPDGRVYQQTIITDAAQGKRFVVDGITESVTTYVLKDESVQALRIPGGRCLSEKGVEAESVFGYTTLRVDAPLADKTIQQWLAPDLNCVPLRTTVSRMMPDGTPKVLLQREVVDIAFGEPDAALFAVPEWPERTPSQVLELFRQKYGLPATAELEISKQQRDRAYRAQQVPRP